jgi:hypothetical protein
VTSSPSAPRASRARSRIAPDRGPAPDQVIEGSIAAAFAGGAEEAFARPEGWLRVRDRRGDTRVRAFPAAGTCADLVVAAEHLDAENDEGFDLAAGEAARDGRFWNERPGWTHDG